LRLLSEGERTGYDIMRELGVRVGWRPSPGSVYPLLQLLADSGLIQGRREGDRTLWSLTPAGQDARAESAANCEEWARRFGEAERFVGTAIGEDWPWGIMPRLASLLLRAFQEGKGERALAILGETFAKLEGLAEVQNERHDRS
jgi:DNA-binding PadR family transcriptional regulator